MKKGVCRFCGAILSQTFADLGMTPLSNAFLQKKRLNSAEKFYPLRTYVCEECLLVQLEEFESPETIFNDYAYFSSYSDTWLNHAQKYAELMQEKFKLNHSSQVIEIASNDGYLLQYFHQRNIPVLGIEPAANVAQVAQEKGIPTLVRFFGVQTAQELVRQGIAANLLLGNNVLAHVPDINDFVAGMKIVLQPEGTLTMEFPHLLQLMKQNQFDTIYHEHFSYFSLSTVEQIFTKHGLTLFDVEELPTHGGSLRIYGKHASKGVEISNKFTEVKAQEIEAGLDKIQTYLDFENQVKKTKQELLKFLISTKQQGKAIAGYGAPAKGNTLLNYCGIRTDFIDYTVDRSPYKQGLFLPGTHIPIYAVEKLRETQPDYILILPWNLREEIISQISYIREWGGKFVVPIPQLEVIA